MSKPKEQKDRYLRISKLPHFSPPYTIVKNKFDKGDFHIEGVDISEMLEFGSSVKLQGLGEIKERVRLTPVFSVKRASPEIISEDDNYIIVDLYSNKN